MGTIMIPVTLAVAAGCALLNLWLQFRVGRTRGREKVSIGDGGSEPLIRRMRAHANFVENAPFVLALVLAIELSAGGGWWLWAAGGLFLVGRLLHPFGMDGAKYGRAIGTAVTMLVLAGLAIWAAALAWHGTAATEGVRTFDAPPTQG